MARIARPLLTIRNVDGTTKNTRGTQRYARLRDLMRGKGRLEIGAYVPYARFDQGLRNVRLPQADGGARNQDGVTTGRFFGGIVRSFGRTR